MWYSTVWCIVMLILSLLAAPPAADAQPRGKVPRIGFLGDGSATARTAQTLEPFREGLRELGYMEGQNVILEVRWTDGHSERLPELAEEFVRLQVDVIVTHGVPGARAAQTATTTIPIVATNVADMVRVGLVASLVRPGGNMTGTSVLLPELSGKLVQLLTEMLPGLTVVGDPLMVEHRTRIAQLAMQERLPVIFTGGRWLVEAGGLMGYGPAGPSSFKRSAVFVDKILKGAKPADLPMEQPMKFELVLNLKTAEALGLTIPPRILFQADEVMWLYSSGHTET